MDSTRGFHSGDRHRSEHHLGILATFSSTTSFDVPDPDQINPKEYKFQSTRDDDVLDLQRQVMHNALQIPFCFDLAQDHKGVVLQSMPPCSLSILDLDQSASTPYDAVLTLANQMLPAIPAEEAALE